MKTSVCKSYDELPLFLNANLVPQVLVVSISTAYGLMHVVVTNSVSLAPPQTEGPTPLLLLSPHKRCALAWAPLGFPVLSTPI